MLPSPPMTVGPTGRGAALPGRAALAIFVAATKFAQVNGYEWHFGAHRASPLQRHRWFPWLSLTRLLPCRGGEDPMPQGFDVGEVSDWAAWQKLRPGRRREAFRSRDFVRLGRSGFAPHSGQDIGVNASRDNWK